MMNAVMAPSSRIPETSTSIGLSLSGLIGAIAAGTQCHDTYD